MIRHRRRGIREDRKAFHGSCSKTTRTSPEVVLVCFSTRMYTRLQKITMMRASMRMHERMGCECSKKLLKVTMSRIKLLRGRREVQVRQLRRDVAQLLQLGQEQNAESRLDRLWKEHSLLSAYIKTGEYCQFVKANLTNIARQRECPMDLKEPLASLCYAASCCADLPELQEIREILVMKYGKDFLVSAYELHPDSGVNKMFLEAFATKDPSEMSKKMLLKGITTEYNLVLPKKTEVQSMDGGLQKTAPSNFLKNKFGCDVLSKNQSGHRNNIKPGSFLKYPKKTLAPEVLEQEEKHHRLSKQTTPNGTCGDPTGFTSSQIANGLDEIKVHKRHKKGQKHLHHQVDAIQDEEINKRSLHSQDKLLKAVSHERPHKERSKSRRKAAKRDARINQVVEGDTLANGRSVYEKSELESAVTEVEISYRNSLLLEETKICESESHKQSQVESHKKSKPEMGLSRYHVDSYGAYHGEAKMEVAIGQPWKPENGAEGLFDDSRSLHMQQKRKLHHKKHDHVENEREVHIRSSGKSKSDMVTDGFDNMLEERIPPQDDGGRTRGVHSQFHRKSRANKFSGMTMSPQQEHNHVETESKREVWSRSDGKSRPVKVKKFDDELSTLNGTHAMPRDSLCAGDYLANCKIGISGNGKNRHGSIVNEAADSGNVQHGHSQSEARPRVYNEYGGGLTALEVKQMHYGYGHGSIPQVYTNQNIQKEGRPHAHGDMSIPQVYTGDITQKEGKHVKGIDEHSTEFKKRFEKDGANAMTRISNPPQRAPPLVPPYRASSLPNWHSPNSPSLPQRCATLEPNHIRQIQEPHVHPKLPEYEDLIASFAALRNKPPSQ